MREIGECFSNEGSCDYDAGSGSFMENFQNKDINSSVSYKKSICAL